MLILVLILCLVPFVDKAFHIDDPLFIWTAESILEKPGDFFGFSVNWVGFPEPMHQAMLNPPLTAYFIAGVIKLFGCTEITLHLAFLLVAIICALGVYELAKEFSSNPFLSALAAVLSPLFVVSASSIMSDVLMLAFLVWSIYLWMRGLRENKHGLFLASAILVCLCILSKYLGALALALILFFHLSTRKRFDPRLLYLAIPILGFLSYELYFFHLYGEIHFNLAASYSMDNKAIIANNVFPALVALVYLGGGFIACFPVFTCSFKGKRFLYVLSATLLACTLFLLLFKDPQQTARFYSESFPIRLLQIAVMIAAGLNIFYIGITRLNNDKDAKSLLLLAWVTGPFLFAGLANWTVNGRTLLPAVPAIAILFISHLQDSKLDINHRTLRISLALVFSALISIAVSVADYRAANSARDSAAFIAGRFTHGEHIAFEGHWGFQYYMQRRGFLPVDYQRFSFNKGDILVIPSNQCIVPVTDAEAGFFQSISRITAYMLPFVGVQNITGPVGFYSSKYGPAPYLFVPLQPERYYIYKAEKDFHIEFSDILSGKWINRSQQ